MGGLDEESRERRERLGEAAEATHAHALARGDVFQAVFNATLDALLLADDRGGCVDANPAACELIGLSARTSYRMRRTWAARGSYEVGYARLSRLPRGSRSRDRS